MVTFCVFYILVMVALLLTVYGHLLTVGDNSYGQLGQGDYRHHEGPCRVQSNLSGDKVLSAACGDGYTIVCTASESLSIFYVFHLIYDRQSIGCLSFVLHIFL